MKTLFKLYGNGDIDFLGNEVIQSGLNGNYIFKDKYITIPKIIELPPDNLKNHFVEKNSEIGWTFGSVVNPPEGNHDRTSAYIDVSEWDFCSLRVEQSNYKIRYSDFRVMFYNSINFTGNIIYYDQFDRVNYEDYAIFNKQIDVKDFNYIRISMDHYDDPIVDMKVMVCEGKQNIDKHYLALDDMPDWFKDTGKPLSIFKEGIVIKGRLINRE